MLNAAQEAALAARLERDRLEKLAAKKPQAADTDKKEEDYAGQG